MGQFTERYEKLQTWAVLPAEPLSPEDGVERLDAAPPPSPTDLGDGSASVSVALPPALPASTDEQEDRA